MVSQMVESTVEAFGGLDIVVNNAGVGREGPIEEMSTEAYRAIMSVNVDGMFFVTRETIPYLRQSEGTLLYVGSGAGKRPRSRYPVYAASKWWTRGFAQSVAAQIGDDDVAVSVVNPGSTRTEFGSEYGDSNREQLDVGEALDPADVADSIVFAVSHDSPTVVSELDVRMRNSP
jgi:NADP-dependent 3-hydroxy acid dehydrogenase YdfG